MSDDSKPAPSDVLSAGGVLTLKTRAQRDAQQEQEYRDEVNHEAVAMLERAIGMVREHRVAGIAIVFAFEDGTYGRLIPDLTSNMAALIGSLATAQHDLILSTLDPDGHWSTVGR